MTGRAVAIQGGLALASLVTAYFTWQRQPELQVGEVMAVDLAPSDLEKVRFEDSDLKSWSELIRDKDKNGPFVALHTSGSDASGVPMPSGHPSVPIKVPERTVRGNDAADNLFKKLAPLRASRALGSLDATKLKDLGLDTTKKHIEVVGRGTRRRFAIAPAPPGGSDPYIRDEADGRVFIVSRGILTDLQSASVNLVERRLHSYPIEDVDRIVITAGTRKKEFRGSRIGELPGIRLSPPGSEKADETAKNWHDRVWNLFPAEVMGKGESPAAGPPKVAIHVDYFSRGHQLGWVELAREAAPMESSAAPASNVAYARSDFSLGWMKLSADAGALITEGEKLVGN
ncbi:MAG TPA: DUF4340 domain-containing protein [Polyangia bacterium]|nr:DUF4340 domain-containing protein [Polyangia bacterium]